MGWIDEKITFTNLVTHSFSLISTSNEIKMESHVTFVSLFFASTGYRSESSLKNINMIKLRIQIQFKSRRAENGREGELRWT